VAWIAGERVVLRAYEREDVRLMWEAAQSPDGRGERLRDWLKPPRSLEEMEREFERNAADPPGDTMEFIIQADGRAVGDIDLFRIDERNRNALVGIGIWRGEDRGKGYGYDALYAVCRWAFEQLNLHRIELACDPENAPAVRIYEKCGFVLEGRRRQHHFQDGGYQDELIMGLLREDFESRDAPKSV
jgi:RimJ/RimL family protein N-acetyltransferase